MVTVIYCISNIINRSEKHCLTIKPQKKEGPTKMEKFLKKGLAILLSLAIVLSMMPAAVFADDGTNVSPEPADEQETVLTPGDDQSNAQDSPETDISSDASQSETPQIDAASNGTTHEEGWLKQAISLAINYAGGEEVDGKYVVTQDAFNLKELQVVPSALGYGGVFTYSSSNTDLATVDNSGNVTITGKQPTGTVTITINATACENDFGTWRADTTTYDLKIVSMGVLDFSEDGEKAAQILQSEGGSATWDNDTKTLTLENINYTVPRATEEIKYGQSGIKPAIALPREASIVLKGNNTIRLNETNTVNRNTAIYFEGLGKIKKAEDAQEEISGVLNINGSIPFGIISGATLVVNNTTVNVDIQMGESQVDSSISATGISTIGDFRGTRSTIKVKCDVPTELPTGISAGGAGAVSLSYCNIDIDVTGKGAVGLEGERVFIAGTETTTKVRINAEERDQGWAGIGIMANSDENDITIKGITLNVVCEGSGETIGLYAGNKITLSGNKQVFVKAAGAAFKANLFSYTSNPAAGGQAFIISNNYDGSNATGVLNSSDFAKFRYFKALNQKTEWLKFADSSTQTVKYCAGTAGARELIYASGYSGEITYTSSDESIATVDSKGNITVNDKGKLGTVTITAHATADSNLNYKASSASYNVKVDGIADFELNGERAAQMLAANGGSAVWNKASKTLTIKDINYTAAPITEGDKSVAVYLPADSTVKVEGENTIKLSEHEENGAAVLYFCGSGKFEGKGTLNIQGQAVAGIYLAELKEATTDLNIANATINCSIVNIQGRGANSGAIYVPRGSIETKNSEITATYSSYDGAAICAGGDIKISGGTVDATGYGANGMGNSNSDKLIITDGNVKSRSDKGYAICFPGGLEIDETAVPTRKVSANFDGSNAVDYGSEDHPSEVRYFEATSKKKEVPISFKYSVAPLGYCDETVTYAVEKPDDYTGKITYTSSDDSIATVDNNGKVTVNSDCKIGSITITAMAEETTKYAKSSASYKLNIVDKADFSVNPERAVQLLKANGGQATWNSATKTLAINGIDYDSGCIFKGDNKDIKLSVEGENNHFRYIATEEGGNTTLSGTGNLEIGNDGDRITLETISLSSQFSGTLKVDVAKLRINNMNIQSGRAEITAQSASQIPRQIIGTLNITGGVFIGKKSDEGNSILSTIKTGDSVKVLGSTNADGSGLVAYDGSNSTAYKYVIASDKQAGYVNFDVEKATVRYIDNTSVTHTATAPEGAGKITYSSSDTNLATVDPDSGKVTINDKGKTGTVKITATCEAAPGFLAESASYDLRISGQLSFDGNLDKERSIQLLKANGTDASWDAETQTLTLNNVNYTFEASSEDNNSGTWVTPAVLAMGNEMNIKLIGDNSITVKGSLSKTCGLKYYGSLTLSGTGSLSINGELAKGIWGIQGSLTLSDKVKLACDVKVCGNALICVPGMEIGANTSVDLRGDYSQASQASSGDSLAGIKFDYGSNYHINNMGGYLLVDAYNIPDGVSVSPLDVSNASYDLNSGTTVLKRDRSAGASMLNTDNISVNDGTVIKLSENYDGTSKVDYNAETYKSNYGNYKYVSISKKDNALIFNKIDDCGYCENPTIVATAASRNSSDGKISYEITEGADIASVTDNGIITINSKGKYGRVTVKATQAETSEYAAATASTSFNVLNVADFTVSGERALQLLNKGKTMFSKARWSSSEKTLTISCRENAQYFNSDIVFPDGNVTINVNAESKRIEFAGSMKCLGRLQIGGKKTTMLLNNLEAGSLELNSTKIFGTEGKLLLGLDGKENSVGNIYVSPADYLEIIGTVPEISGSVDVVGALRISGTVEDLNELKLNYQGAYVDINGTVNSLNVLNIQKGTVKITGESVPTALANITMDETNVWAVASVNPDGSDAEPYDSANKEQYRYFRATSAKTGNYLSFAEENATVDYCANNLVAPTLNVAEDYNGTVTYKSSDETLATVDANTGKVTLNNNGKTGSVTITASGTMTNKYAAAEASYTLDITADVVDFGLSGTRAAQILAANGGSAVWDEDTNTLTIEGINYEKTGAIPEDDDNGYRILLPNDVTVIVNGTNTIKSSDCAYVISFMNNGTIKGKGTLNVSGIADADGLYPDTPVYISGKLTIDGATVNTSNASYGFSGDRGCTLDVQAGCAYAKGSNKALSANVDFTYFDSIRVNASTTEGGDLGTYDVKVKDSYKQIRAKYVAANEVTFTKTIADFDYYAKSKDTITATGLGTGEITYEVTEGADIATVDKDGNVTINSDGKFGTVTITATQSADDDYAEASASYSFNVRGVADFSSFAGDSSKIRRALQLLNATGGKATYTYGSNNTTCRLTLEDVNFDSKSRGYAIKLRSYSQIVVKGENTIHGGIWIGSEARDITGSGTLNITDAATGLWANQGVVFDGGVTVNLTNVGVGFDHGWSSQKFNFKNCAVTVAAGTKVLSKPGTNVGFDENIIKAVASTNQDGSNLAKFNVNQKNSYKYFSATVKKTITATEAYGLKSGDILRKEFGIDGAAVDPISEITKKSAEYDGDIAKATIKYKSKDSQDEPFDKITAPDIYDVVLSMPATENYQPIEAAVIGTLIVDKGIVQADAAVAYEEQTVEYDGQEHIPAITAVEGYDGAPVLSYKDTTDENAQITSEAPKNAGTYEVYVSAAETFNFWGIEKGKVGTFTITPKQFTADQVANVSQSEELTYNGNKQDAQYTLTDEAKAIGYDGTIKLVYMQNGAEVTNINAGTYEVYASAAATRNFAAITAGKIGSFNIGKKTVTKDEIFDYATAQTAKYDGSSPKFVIKVKDSATDYDGTAVITYKQGDKVVEAPTAVGTYDVYIALSDNTNYVQDAEDKETKAATLTIAKGDNSLTFEKTIAEIGYCDETFTNTATGNGNSAVTYAVTEGADIVSVDETTGKVTINAEGKFGQVTITATQAEDDSYEEATASYSFNVRGIADFTKNSVKALELLNADAVNATYFDKTLTITNVSFDSKLGVDNADITRQTAEFAVILPADTKLVVNGTNTINGGVRVEGKATVEGEGTLNIEDAQIGLYAKQGITFDKTVTMNINAKQYGLTTDSETAKANFNGKITVVGQANAFEPGQTSLVWDDTYVIATASIHEDGAGAATYNEENKDTYKYFNLKFKTEVPVEAFGVSNNTYTYDGTAKAATVTLNKAFLYKESDSETWTIEYKAADGTVTGNAVNAGTYDILLSAPATATYQAIDKLVVGQLIINKANVKASEQLTYAGETFAYDGTPKQATTVVKKENAIYDGTWTLSYKNGEADVAEPTEAGTYDVYATIEETDNCDVAEATAKVGTLIIEESDVNVEDLFEAVDVTATYDGSEHKAELTLKDTEYPGLADVTISYIDSNNQSVEAPVKAGTYKVMVSALAVGNYKGFASTQIGTVTINKAQPDKTAFANIDVNVPYDGNAKSAEVKTSEALYNADKPVFEVSYKKFADGTETEIEGEPVDAGTYNVYVQAAATDNFEALKAIKVGQIVITAAGDVEFTIDKTTPDKVIYDGNVHTVNVVASDSNYDGTTVVTYEKDGKTVENPTDAGAYLVYVQAAATDNYQAVTKTKVGTLTIAKATVAAGEAFSYENETFAYDGEAKTATVTAKELINGFKMTPVISYKQAGASDFMTEAPVNAGKYEVFVGAEATDNYNAIEPVSMGWLTITAIGNVTLSLDKDANAPTYDGTPKEATVKASDDKYDGNITVEYFKLTDGTETKVDGKPTDAGTYFVYASAAATTNFEAINRIKIGEFVINKATATIDEAFNYETAKAVTVKYDGEAKSVEVTANELINGFTMTPVIKYTITGQADFLESNPTEVGTYDVYLGAKEADNYNAIDPAKIGTLTITAIGGLTFSIAEGTNDVTYDGEPHYVTVASSDENYPIDNLDTVYTDGEGKEVAKPTVAGTYTVYVSAEAVGGYEAITKHSIGTLTIKPAEITTGELVNDFKNNNETTTDGEGNTSLKVTATYDGQPHTINMPTDGQYKDLKITYTAEDGTETFAPIQAGTYDISAEIKDMPNYEDTTVYLGMLIIDKATVTIDEAFDYEAAKEVTVTYNGEAKSVEVTAKELINGFKMTPVISYKKAGETDFLESNPTEVGTYDVYLEAKATDNYNAIEAEKIGTLTINKTGVIVGGTLTSFGSNTDDVTIQLIRNGESDVAYETTVQGNTADYSITGVVSGTYTMKIMKKNHVSREYTVTVGTDSVVQDAKIHLKGDINGDGIVNTSDNTLMMRHIKQTKLLTDYSLLVADINGDSVVNTSDNTLMMRHIKQTKLLW